MIGVQNSNYIIDKAEFEVYQFMCGHNELLIFTSELNRFIHPVLGGVVIGIPRSEMHCGKAELRDPLYRLNKRNSKVSEASLLGFFLKMHRLHKKQR